MFSQLYILSLILVISLAKKPADSDCDCNLKPDPGPCKAYFPRYYYDHEYDECKKFIYGGCQGNGNNFVTLTECAESCMDIDPKCLLPKVPGPCRGSMVRWFHNITSNQCEKFIYGGCQGNDNNFQSCQECLDQCGYSPKECLLPKEVGPCKGNLKRFYYNPKSKRCERFYYGGCKGNANNFKDYCKCKKRCHNITTCFNKF